MSSSSDTSSKATPKDSGDIAIVGLGAKMPGALSADDFWDNIKNEVYAIDEVPPSRWDPELYYDPDPEAPEKTYSKIGGWVTGFEFDHMYYRIPPLVVENMDSAQQLALETVREALETSGYEDKDFDRENCAVILGNSLGGELRDWTNLRIQFPEFAMDLRETLQRYDDMDLTQRQIDEIVADVKERFQPRFPRISEDAMPGELPNVIAGRVANAFNLRGPNFVADAACAGSLAAVEQAVRGLRQGAFDMAVTGGSDQFMGPTAFVKFCKIGALSPDGSRPFDANANGFVMGEGCGVLLLKRLEDAERDDDDILGVIKGVGGSSDGSGKGITAPNQIGQELAIKRAYNDAGYGPRSLSLYEAHGTSTPVGDPSEFQSVSSVVSEDSGPAATDRIAMGSVKSMIGHLKAGAGAASLVKVTKALNTKTLPPTLNVEEVNPEMNIEETPFEVQHHAEPWELDGDIPRRAGVSAFGFGGTNFHITLEEYDPNRPSKKWSGSESVSAQTDTAGRTASASEADTSSTARSRDEIDVSEGLLALTAQTEDELAAAFADLKAAVEERGLEATRPFHVDLQADDFDLPEGPWRLAIAYGDAEEFEKQAGRIESSFERGKGWNILANQGVYLSSETQDGDIAMLFPGQGTQYLGMLSDLKQRFPVVREVFDEADRVMSPVLGQPLSRIIDPDDWDDEAQNRLKQTENTQPAVLTADVALLKLLEHFGLQPDVVAGHSLGEYGALVAAGVMPFENALQTVARRGTAMAEATPMNGDKGLMASVPLPPDEVERKLETIDGYVVCANKNCPRQTIIAGLTEPTRAAAEMFEDEGHMVQFLNVSHAFHSKVVAAGSKPLREHLSGIDIKPPEVPILTNVTGGYHPSDPDEIRDLLAEQVAAPVEWVTQIERMYEDGARTFVEVGPKSALTTFTESIIGRDRDYVAVHTNHPKEGGTVSLYRALGRLWSEGVWNNTRRESARTRLRAPETADEASTSSVDRPSREEVLETMLEVLCEKTGYDPAEIEYDFELEADLGVDTVKQAEILAEVREKWGLPKDEDFRFSDYPTLERLADYVEERFEVAHGAGAGTGASTDSDGDGDAESGAEMSTDDVSPDAAPEPKEPKTTQDVDRPSREEVLETMLEVLCEKTGYDPAEIEYDFELEADLGVDTVKQAEILAEVREKWGLPKDEDFRFSDYPTLERLADYVEERFEVAHGAGATDASTDSGEDPDEESGAEMSTDDVSAETTPEPNEPATTQDVDRPSREEVLETMLEVLCEKTGYDPAEIEYDFELEADLGVDTVKQAEILAEVREKWGLPKDEDFRFSDYPTLERLADYVEERFEVAHDIETHDGDTDPDTGTDSETETSATPAGERPSREEVLDTMLEVLCEKTGYDPAEIEYDFELEADLGVDTVKQAEILAEVREKWGLPKDEGFRFSDYPTLERLADYVEERFDATQNFEQAGGRTDAAEPADQTGKTREITQHERQADIVVSGGSLGLPGTDEVFCTDAVERLLNGENFIGSLSDEARQRIVDKNITRLEKHEDGGGHFEELTDLKDVIQLAARKGEFNLEEWGVPDRLIKALDDISQLAFAAGLEALRDAGIPLQPRYRTTRSGKKITDGWQLPGNLGDETGIIFATAFAGNDALIEEVKNHLNDEGYEFNHRLLLRILGMANARFAEYIGARGPNTTINNACASTTTAIGLAQDWIAQDRCDRVVILSSDDATGDSLLEWVGSGFLATGAATTEEDVDEAALPFDRRRNGMIVGMGAVGLVIEKAGLPESRGIEPIADVLGTHYVNSAHHPTRLDIDHISREVNALMERAERDFDFRREDIADRTVFVSHETYTPARGGSADAEISAIRNTFGDQADDIVIANTKGFTGHAQGASIEEMLAIKGLQHERIPPIANFEEPDPNLGNLRLSEGGEYPVDYALRLAAGFGSQLALVLYRYRARTEDRTYDPGRYRAWLKETTGFDSPTLVDEDRTLRVRDDQPGDHPSGPDGGGESGESSSTKEEAPEEGDAPEPVQEPDPTPAPAGVESFDDGSPRRAPAGRHTPDIRTSREDADRFPTEAVLAEAHTSAAYDLIELRERLDGEKVAILAGPMLVTNLMSRALERCGAEVLVLEDRDNRSPLAADETTCDLFDESAIAAAFDEIAGTDAIHGIVNLLGFGSEEYEAEDTHRVARQTFHVARGWTEHLDGEPADDQFFLSVTGMGGRLGFDRATQPLPVCGAVCGLTKALNREWEELESDADVKVVDVPREGLYPDLGLQILAETFSDEPVLEIGLLGGVRYEPVTLPAREIIGHGAGTSLAPDSDSVILVAGGGKGITAEIAVDLAERYGCSLALVGRTQLKHDAPLSVDMDAAKAKAKERIDERGDRVTPVRVKNELKPLRSQRSIQENINRMEKLGADVEYFSCDVAEPDAVDQLVDDVIARFGSVDGVIHGAGAERSEMLQDKTAESFDVVFRGKALGGLNLWKAVRDQEPDFFAMFSSVVARYGNVGQCDYASANEVLNKLIAQINATSSTAGISFDWTAWDEVGMAVEGSIKTILEHRGVEFLPPDIGAPMVADSLELGLTGELMVAGELGQLEGNIRMRRHGPGTREEPPAEQFAFATKTVESEDDRLVVERTFDSERDRFLGDHVYEGNPVLPGVMGFELIEETARQLVGRPVTALQDVSFERAIKLHHGDPIRVITTAEIVGREGGEPVVEVTVSSEREVKTGRTIRNDHFSGVARFDQRDADSDEPEPLVFDDTARYDEGPDRGDIYKRFFHTGLFRVMDSVPHLGDDVVLGYGRNPRGPLIADQSNDRFISDPMVREMGFQTTGLWGMMRNDTSYLPYGIGEAVQFGHAAPGETVCIRAERRREADTDHTIAFDVEIRADDGRLLQRMSKVELVGHRALDDDETFEALAPRRMTQLRLSHPEAEALLADRDLERDAILTDSERQSWERLKSDRRRGEWLAARVAAKELVSRHIRDFTGYRPDLGDVVISKDEHGAPYVQLRGEAANHSEGFDAPSLTLTHANGVAIAGLAAPGPRARIGTDLEAIEERDASFAENYFSSHERSLTLPGPESADDSTTWTALWSIKEAVSKALGLGLKLSLAEISIEDLREVPDGRIVADVALSGAAESAFEHLGGTDLEVWAETDGTFALAHAYLTVDDASASDGRMRLDRSRSDSDSSQSSSPDPADSGNGELSDTAASTDETTREFAAVAALLEHKGHLDAARSNERDDEDAPTRGKELSSWKKHS
jgi:malonyl CoA-acyl carrier protein transacylase